MIICPLVFIESLRFGSDRSVVIATYLRYGRVGCIVYGRGRGGFYLLLDDRKRSTLVVVSVSHVLVEELEEVLVQGHAGEMRKVSLTSLSCVCGADRSH